MSSPERARPQDFVDLEIRIFPKEAAGYPVEITLDKYRGFERGYVSPAIVPWVSSGALAEDGQKLFDVLLADQVLREAWNTSHEAAPRRRVRLRIDADATELHALPWELLQSGPVMLSAQTDTPFSRYFHLDMKIDPVEERPIRVLVVISDPDDLQDKYDLAPVDVAQERASLQAAFDTVGADELQADFLDAPATPERLEAALRGTSGQALRDGYHALHFVGHGAFSRRRGQSALYMQDEQGRAQRVLDDELVSLLARQGVQPQLVLLAACQSATRSMADAFLGLGPKLVRAGVPAVVAMQDVVTVETARKFSATFYRQLLAHDQVDLAVNEARSTLLTAGRADAAVPVLFMRLRDGLLFAPSDASDSDTGQPRIHIGQINVQNVEDSTVSITTTTGK